MGATTFIKSETEFDSLLANEPLLVVDFTAPWCGPCKVVGPLMDQLAGEYSDNAKVFKVDLDDHKSMAKRFGIRSIPAVMYFKQGELVKTIVGVKSYEEFSDALREVL